PLLRSYHRVSVSVPTWQLPAFPTRRSSDLSGPHLEGLMRMMFPSSLEPLVVNWTVAGPLLALAGLALTAMLAISQIAAWAPWAEDRKSTRLNSSHVKTSYAVFCLKKKTTIS